MDTRVMLGKGSHDHVLQPSSSCAFSTEAYVWGVFTWGRKPDHQPFYQHFINLDCPWELGLLDSLSQKPQLSYDEGERSGTR